MKTIILSLVLLNGLFFSVQAADAGSPIPSNISRDWPEVSQFQAQLSGTRVVLTWKASADEQVVYYVEKSTDSKHFSTVAVVMGGFANGNGYDFEFREKSANGKAVYRIKQIKQDGSSRIAGEQSL
jgi:hypothetical protein